MRIDTPGGRFLEGLDPAASYAVLERNVPDAIRGYRNETELRYLVGAGVSAAAIWHLREALDAAKGFDKVKIVASSGFNPAKCKLMAEANAPIDVIGTGSYLPEPLVRDLRDRRHRRVRRRAPGQGRPRVPAQEVDHLMFSEAVMPASP